MADTASTSTTEEDAVGLWRDGDILVVSRENHRFPSRCIKSNATADVSWHTISSDPRSAVVSGFAITAAMLSGPGDFMRTVDFMGDMKKRQVFLSLPISASWYARWRRTSRIGWSLVLGGILCFIGATAGYMACMAYQVPEAVANLVLIPFLLAIPASIAGLIYLVVSHKPVFTLKKVTSDHLWIVGASREFLSLVPQWEEGDMVRWSRNPG